MTKAKRLETLELLVRELRKCVAGSHQYIPISGMHAMECKVCGHTIYKSIS